MEVLHLNKVSFAKLIAQKEKPVLLVGGTASLPILRAERKRGSCLSGKKRGAVRG